MPPASEDIRHAVREELREPTTAMTASFRALPPEHRALLVALLDAPPGPVPERELTAAARRHADGGLRRSPAELVDRLADHFVRVVETDSVVWVHPSWRDLVIDELAHTGDERRRFLTRCGLDGLLLALSTGGGAAGERRFPLLIDDADWDALTERLHTVIAALDDHDLFRLLATLREATATGEPEVKAVTETVLAAMRRTWDDAGSPIPVGLLATWLELAERTGAEMVPRLAPTWIDLVPTESIDMGLRDDVRRLDDWIALVEILRNRFQQPLSSFGYPDAQVAAIEAAVVSARRLAFTDVGDDVRTAVASVLRKLWRVAPVEVRDAIEALERAEPSDVDWWEPHLPRVRPRTRPERTIVARILDDLRPATG
jgi:hypothetical protein